MQNGHAFANEALHPQAQYCNHGNSTLHWTIMKTAVLKCNEDKEYGKSSSCGIGSRSSVSTVILAATIGVLPSVY